MLLQLIICAVDWVCRSCFIHLRHLSRVTQYHSHETAIMAANALVNSSLSILISYTGSRLKITLFSTQLHWCTNTFTLVTLNYLGPYLTWYTSSCNTGHSVSDRLFLRVPTFSPSYFFSFHTQSKKHFNHSLLMTEMLIPTM